MDAAPVPIYTAAADSAAPPPPPREAPPDFKTEAPPGYNNSTHGAQVTMTVPCRCLRPVVNCRWVWRWSSRMESATVHPLSMTTGSTRSQVSCLRSVCEATCCGSKGTSRPTVPDNDEVAICTALTDVICTAFPNGLLMGCRSGVRGGCDGQPGPRGRRDRVHLHCRRCLDLPQSSLSCS